MSIVRIKERLVNLPPDPGVYLMKDANGDYIYIGKAKSLSDRVRSYFQEGAGLTPRIRSMIGNVNDIEFIVTGSELEALILENNLIKKHKPRYNVILRDDKNYPFLRLPIKDDFPRLEVVRRVKRDGALYFGPYVPANALRETLKVIRRVFLLATCKIKIDGKAPVPCMQFQIKRCMAPCTGNQTKEEYHEIVRQVKMFLEGKDRELLNSMKAEMEAASDRLDFEGA
ncbi:MAG: GIY-YIG nuclease family protein, partial [Nitrospirota bacterium]